MLTVLAFDPVGGHGGNYVYDLAFLRALARCDVRVIWTTCDETPIHSDPEVETWRPFRGIYGSAPAALRGLRFALGLLALLLRARRLSKSGPVIIHQQFVTVPFLERQFVVLARLLSIPRVLTVHDVMPFARKRLRSERQLTSLYRRYDGLIVHSNAAALELQAMIAATGLDTPPIHIIPHGHYNNSYVDADLPRSLARQRLGISAEKRMVLFLGQVKRDKGLDILLEAFAKAVNEVPDAALVIAGRSFHDSPLRYEALADKLGIREKLTFRWEYVPDEELAVYYRAADVVALPYRRVYQSGVCLTAYAFRRAVVATAVGGLREQVVDGTTGVLVAPGDPDAFSAALVTLLRNRHCDDMGNAGHQWAAERCDWDIVASETVAAYSTALKFPVLPGLPRTRVGDQ
ncbi:MAG TPA: glycosyltransferase family 4 protein [Candidatus Nitrosotalea sp.]|nr:glycosyltransferase family 4 protein [Candidatus Nitrosotalea sp.]